MKYDRVTVPCLKVHPSKIITYYQTQYLGAKPSFQKRENANSSQIVVEVNGKLEFKRVSNSFLNSTRKSTGELSKIGKKKLTTAIEYFLLLNKPNNSKSGYTGRNFSNKIAFITLTLPSKQLHSDKEIKEKCLNQFLIELSRYHKVSQYVWRSEYQKNGNIHFHILVNRYVWWNDVRNRWNRIINKLGYVEEYHKELTDYHKHGFQVRADLLKQWPLEKQYQAWKAGKKSDWNNPNSIDVHGLKNISNVKNYLIKYMSKSEQTPPQTTEPPETLTIETLNDQLVKQRETGRIWGCSIIFSNIKGATTEIDSKLEETLKTLEEHFPNSVYKSDYFTIIEINLQQLESLKCLELLNLFRKYLLDTFNFCSQMTI